MNPFRTTEWLRRACVALMFIVLHGCAPLQPGPGAAPSAPVPGPGPAPQSNAWLGRIARIDGPNAFFDRGGSGLVYQATEGQLLFANDRFFTGRGTHMLVQFNGGGYVELDENTDPTLIQELNCLVISLFRSGQMFVDKSNACVQALQVASNQHSKVVYSVMPGSLPGLRITVIEGEAELVRPVRAPVPTGWRIEADGRGVMGNGRAYPLPPEELQRSVQWLRLVRVAVAPTYVPPPPPPAVVVTPPPYSTFPFPPPRRYEPRQPVPSAPSGTTGGAGGTQKPPSGAPGTTTPTGPSGSGTGTPPGTTSGTRGVIVPPAARAATVPSTQVTKDPTAKQRAQRATQPDNSGIR